MFASCIKLIDSALFCVGVASEALTLFGDICEKNGDATSFTSKVAALFFRVFSRNASSTDVAMGLKACEGAARIVIFCTSDRGKKSEKNYEAGSALAGIARCVFEGATLYEKSWQEYAHDHPDETYPKYECEWSVISDGSSFQSVCKRKIVGNEPFDFEAAKQRELGGTATADVATMIETATRLHQALSRHYRDVEFEPYPDRPPVPVLQSIPKPVCPITKREIEEPCRDKSKPNELFEYQALVEQNDPVTQDAIELVKFTT